jgi:hypothetical protein
MVNWIYWWIHLNLSTNIERKNRVEQQTDNGKKDRYRAVGIGIGLALGAGMGVAMHNIAVGVGAGLAIGVAIGVALSRRNTDQPGNQ